MAYVITRLCIDCVDKACADVCPVECIYALASAPTADLPNMLYIHPGECISCAACEPECPWQAIFEDREMPDLLAEDAALNAKIVQHPEQFCVARLDRSADGHPHHAGQPTKEQVRANRAKYGLR
jgi:ferredoxin